jgi:uncharacterized DUF497 family protein
MELIFHYRNLDKHNVSEDEAEQAFNDPNGLTEKRYEGIYVCLGKTLEGRLLEMAYRKLNKDQALIFHAMNARDNQKKRYKKRI